MENNSENRDDLRMVEELFAKYGARPAPPEVAARMEKSGLRPWLLLDGIYYRVEEDEFDDQKVIVITATKDPDYARLGLGDNLGGFRADIGPERMDREVRFAIGLEPYPETYPDY